jgi:hypothetical protein
MSKRRCTGCRTPRPPVNQLRHTDCGECGLWVARRDYYPFNQTFDSFPAAAKR